ncbi:MAG: hypothetical protein QGG36_13385 [Pirellulaceae bacterium]|jgi:hypothetical protein|nr:hypothetical protein [Pirellulaceae bacterium]MDP7016789.1 hypothetical protein [Pirellulaceae bacterium]
MTISRRRFLAASTVPLAATLAPASFPATVFGKDDDRSEALPVAAVVTVYKKNSHADVICGKILEGFRQDGGPGPKLKLVSMYTDQVPAGDMSRGLAEKHGFRIAETIDETLTLGSDRLQVAGVLNVGEHGDYPYTEDTKQHQYPRRRFFDDVVAAFRRVKQVAPLFNDKHLSYRFADAKHMYDTARKLKIPFMAGSSLPVAWRIPHLTIPRDAELQEAITVGYGGSESYGFHALETLQCMVERRRGGETGVESVQAVSGPAITAAEKAGRWSPDLLDAALAKQPKPVRRPLNLEKGSVFYLLKYRDGFQATVAMVRGASEFTFAAKQKDVPQPHTSWFYLEPRPPYGHFEYLVRAIEHCVHEKRPPYPVERTLLTTGVLDELMHSLAEDGGLRRTPQLAIKYQPTDWPFATKLPPMPVKKN